MNNEIKFKAGDIVEFGGNKGVVLEEVDSSFINCRFTVDSIFIKDFFTVTFTKEGRLYSWNKEPSLKLIERPKKKVKKYKVLYRDAFHNYAVSSSFYEGKADFDLCSDSLKFIQLIKESEIEVEKE